MKTANLISATILTCACFCIDAAPGGNMAWGGRPVADVEASYAANINIRGCRFANTSSTAVDFNMGVKDSNVEDCTFNHVGGTAVLTGFFGDENFEAHKAWNPENKADISANINIRNNNIESPAYDDWGCVAIGVGFAQNITIDSNDIADTPYSAISVGWGWTLVPSCLCNNVISNNYIHGFCTQMRDGGAIYTLSSQPGSVICRNSIEGAGNPPNNPLMWPGMTHAQFDLYTDEGSDFFTISNNYLSRGEISRNKNGQNNHWENNGPDTIVKKKTERTAH